VRGRIERDDRQVDPSGARLGEVETVPVGDFAITLRQGADVLAQARTDHEGRFEVPLGVAPRPDLELLLEAADAPKGGPPSLAIFDSDGVSVPGAPGTPEPFTRLWAWVASASHPDVDATDFGVIHLDLAAGAGAIALLEQLRAGRARVGAFFGRSELPSLAVLWNTSLTPSCLSCYLPAAWGPFVWRSAEGDQAFDGAMFLSGAPAAPHHFTPSLVLHELGHWVLDTVSRHPDVGGAHGWDQLVDPPLAWSEGFATFFAQWSLSSPSQAAPRFFTVQSNIPYWIDLEAVGRGPASDESSLSVAFPLPTPDGGVAQPMNEAVVAAVLWDLWDGPAEGGDDRVVLGDRVLSILTSDRLTKPDSGAGQPALVDYLDALACAGAFDGVPDLASALLGFPWVNTPRCE